MFASFCSSLSSLLSDPERLERRDRFIRGVEAELQRDTERLQQVEDCELYVRDVEDCERWVESNRQALQRAKTERPERYEWYVEGVQLAEQQLTRARAKLALWQTDPETAIAMRRSELTRCMIEHVDRLRRLDPRWQPKRSVVLAPPPAFDTTSDTSSSAPTDDPLTPTSVSLLHHRRQRAHSLTS